MFSELSKILTSVSGNSVFVTFSSDVFDFTDKSFVPELKFYVPGKEFKLLLTEEKLPGIVTMLKLSIFKKESKIITWNWKIFASYVLAKTGKLLSIEGAIIDLKIIESYSGLRLKVPATLVEALNRLKNLISLGFWKDSELVYKKIHLPLITTVIPNLETVGILDISQKSKIHAFYEIEGQNNGRLRCFNAYSQGYVPHAMTSVLRDSLKPRSHDELFMVFDYKGMEVFVLAHLSKDLLLQELCKSPDIYEALYEKILNKKSEGKIDRDFTKKMFLPVIYGQSAYSLSQRCGIAIDVAEMIINKIYSLFPSALAFVESYQKQLQELGYAKDVFGKRRDNFEEGKEYAVRNFAIQAPASVVCLEKLVQLYFALKNKTDLAYTIHDGYAAYATKENWKTIYKIGHDILSSESEMCPGLRLRVTCRAGRNLNDLKSLTRRGE